MNLLSLWITSVLTLTPGVYRVTYCVFGVLCCPPVAESLMLAHDNSSELILHYELITLFTVIMGSTVGQVLNYKLQFTTQTRAATEH